MCYAGNRISAGSGSSVSASVFCRAGRVAQRLGRSTAATATSGPAPGRSAAVEDGSGTQQGWGSGWQPTCGKGGRRGDAAGLQRLAAARAGSTAGLLLVQYRIHHITNKRRVLR